MIGQPAENKKDLDRIVSQLSEGEDVFIDDFTDWYTETLLANTRVELDDEEVAEGLDSQKKDQEAVPPALPTTSRGSPEFGTQTASNQRSTFQFNLDSKEKQDTHCLLYTSPSPRD